MVGAHGDPFRQLRKPDAVSGVAHQRAGWAVIQLIALRQFLQHPVAPAFAQHRFIGHCQRQNHKLAAFMGVREIRQIVQIGAGKPALLQS